jgi:hypothetical protein
MKSFPSTVCAAIALATALSTSRSLANDFKCDIHVPRRANYHLELFRVGDQRPTRVYNEVIDRDYTVTIRDLPAGSWFVRATNLQNPYSTGQGPSWYIMSWVPWTQWIPDVWVRL